MPVKDIGELDKRVEVQQVTRTRTASGQASESWETVATRWAKIEPLSSDEAQVEWFTDRSVRATQRHWVTLRYFEGLTADYRFLYKGRVFHIRGAADVMEDGVFTVCLCFEGVGE